MPDDRAAQRRANALRRAAIARGELGIDPFLAEQVEHHAEILAAHEAKLAGLDVTMEAVIDAAGLTPPAARPRLTLIKGDAEAS